MSLDFDKILTSVRANEKINIYSKIIFLSYVLLEISAKTPMCVDFGSGLFCW